MSKDMRDWPRANLGVAAKCSEPVLSTIEHPRRAFAVPGPEMLERPRQTLSPSAVPSCPGLPGGLPVASRQAGSLHGGGGAEAGAGEVWPQQSVDHWRHQRARPEAKEITDVCKLPGHNLRDRVIVDRYIDVLNVLVVAAISLIL